MKSFLFSLICIFLVACQQQLAKTDDMKNLMQAIDTFYAAVEAGDFDARIAMFADSAMVIPNGGSIIHGKDTIKELWSPYQKYIFRIKDLERMEVKISGEYAHTVNSYYYTWHLPGEEAIWHKTNNIHIWQRQPDGKWKLYLDIWNSAGE